MQIFFAEIFAWLFTPSIVEVLLHLRHHSKRQSLAHAWGVFFGLCSSELTFGLSPYEGDFLVTIPCEIQLRPHEKVS